MPCHAENEFGLPIRSIVSTKPPDRTTRTSSAMAASCPGTRDAGSRSPRSRDRTNRRPARADPRPLLETPPRPADVPPRASRRTAIDAQDVHTSRREQARPAAGAAAQIERSPPVERTNPCKQRSNCAALRPIRVPVQRRRSAGITDRVRLGVPRRAPALLPMLDQGVTVLLFVVGGLQRDAGSLDSPMAAWISMPSTSGLRPGGARGRSRTCSASCA